MYLPIFQLVMFLKILVATSQNVEEFNPKSSEQIELWKRLEEEVEQRGQFNGIDILEELLEEIILKTLIDLSSENYSNVSALLDSAYKKMGTLSVGRTLKDTARMVDKHMEFPSNEIFPDIIKSANSDMPGQGTKKWEQMTNMAFEALGRTLNFYDAQLDQIYKSDTVIGLLFLKDIDDKHGQKFQEKFPLEQWAKRVCDSNRKRSETEAKFCHSLVSQWTNRTPKANFKRNTWKQPSILQKLINLTDSNILKNIGSERDGMWGSINGQCQIAIVNRCELPYACERTFLDPTPRSQYLLTHQFLQRLLIDNMDCPEFKSLLTDQDIYTNLCSKMYMEAHYLDVLGVPILQRDLFAEYVGFCGFMGYGNFIRQDWFEKILSWQSKSDYGCFTKSPLTPIGLLTSDVGFKRRSTKKELDEGVLDSGEKCLPHFTTIGLVALAVHWDYLMDSNPNK